MAYEGGGFDRGPCPIWLEKSAIALRKIGKYGSPFVQESCHAAIIKPLAGLGLVFIFLICYCIGFHYQHSVPQSTSQINGRSMISKRLRTTDLNKQRQRCSPICPFHIYLRMVKDFFRADNQNLNTRGRYKIRNPPHFHDTFDPIKRNRATNHVS